MYNLCHTCVLLGVAMMLAPSSEFFLNHFGLELGPNDYTLSSIIKEVVLEASVYYFNHHDPPSHGRPAPDVLTETSVIHWRYGDTVSPEKLASAIQDIVDKATTVCSVITEEFSFINEQIYRGNDNLVRLYMALNDELSSSSPDFASIRKLIGFYLCGMTSFYSNTNWVETFLAPGETREYSDLGVPGQTLIFVPDKYEATCRDCPLLYEENRYNCIDNLNVQGRILTSGYFGYKPMHSVTSETLGKCSLGGRLDETEILPAQGGINKKSSNPSLSPHYQWHQQAGASAVKAGIRFLINNNTGVFRGENLASLRDVLQLSSGTGLLFVIDDTSSMTQEISMVRQKTIEIAESRAGALNAPETYTFVTFNDPTVGAVFRTTNITEFTRRIAAIDVHGGGDCPEMAMTGMLKAINSETAPVSDMFVFTDAPAKDESRLLSSVIASAKAKKIRVMFLISKGCLTSGSRAAYLKIGSHTGGGAYLSRSDSDFNRLTTLIDKLTEGGVSVLYQVTTGIQAETVHFRVDSSIRNMFVVVSSMQAMSQSVKLIDPTGTIIRPKFKTTTLAMFDVSDVTEGSWNFSTTAGAEITVTMFGQAGSAIGFYMLDIDSNGNAVPLTTKPSPGDRITVVVDLLGDPNIVELERLFLLNLVGSVIAQYTTVMTSQAVGWVQIIYPEESFTMRVEGRDRSGRRVARADTRVREPVSFKLVRTGLDGPVSVKPGEIQQILIQLQNNGSAGRYVVSKIDPDDVINDIAHDVNRVDAHGIANITALIYVANDTHIRQSNPVIIVEMTLGGETVSNSLQLSVVVTSEPPPVVKPPTRPTVETTTRTTTPPSSANGLPIQNFLLILMMITWPICYTILTN